MKYLTSTYIKKLALAFPLAFLILTGMTSCDAIYEDMPECAPAPDTYTVVDFVYDYNMQKKDLLKEHIGSVYLYVFDTDGIYRIRREVHRSDMKGDIDFSMRFDTTEIVPGNTYWFVAVAQANHVGYQASLETPGFTLDSEMIPGISTIYDYRLKLDRDDNNEYDFGVVDYKDVYGNTETMMDTIWSTRPDEVQVAQIPRMEYKPSLNKQPDQVVNVTIPMMRITNSLTVRLANSNFDENTSADKYHLLIHFPHGNGTIDFTGNTLPDKEFYYRTLRKNMVHVTTETRAGEDADAKDVYDIQGVFGLSRLTVGDESSLQIRDGETYEILAEIPNFSEFLAKYFEHGFDDDQEFLDREYDFELEVNLTDEGKINYIDIIVAVLGWHVRVSYADL